MDVPKVSLSMRWPSPAEAIVLAKTDLLLMPSLLLTVPAAAPRSPGSHRCGHDFIALLLASEGAHKPDLN